LSSTYRDLIEHRRYAADAIERLGQQTSRMEVFGARPEEPLEACIQEIDQSDLFVGIYAHRYGYIPEGSDVSITESEFQYAKRKEKALLCFIVDEDHPWPPPMIDGDPGQTKLARFKDALRTRYVRETFTTPQDLASKVATSVGRYIVEASSPLHPLVTGLRKLINESSDKEEADRKIIAETLSAAVEIANRTLQYFADRRRTRERDFSRERELAIGWREAGVKLVGLKDPPIQLAERYFLKAEYWSSPEDWTEERIKASEIGLAEIATESRSMLLSRISARPGATAELLQRAPAERDC
jgi:Domain of unknown function (DUF4062)